MVNQYCAHSFTRNWQLPFLNQRKGENDCRIYFMINLHERMLPTSAKVEPTTSWSPVGRRIQLSHRDNQTSRSWIYLAQLHDRLRKVVETAANTPGHHNNRIHPKIVQNRLKEVGLYTRKPYVGQHLMQIRHQKRMKWLRRYSLHQFPMHQLIQVVFSDE